MGPLQFTPTGSIDPIGAGMIVALLVDATVVRVPLLPHPFPPSSGGYSIDAASHTRPRLGAR
jgi:hypothetical protein